MIAHCLYHSVEYRLLSLCVTAPTEFPLLEGYHINNGHPFRSFFGTLYWVKPGQVRRGQSLRIM